MRRSYKILLVISLITLAVIWGHSMMPPSVSSDESGFVMKIIEPFLEIFVGRGSVTEHLVRKLGHFTEYTIFGVELAFLSAVFPEMLRTFKRRFAGVIFTAFTAAFIDETIQIFSGRGPMITDVWIDIAGAVLGSGAVLIIQFIISRSRDPL